jgi:hypothetical protein
MNNIDYFLSEYIENFKKSSLKGGSISRQEKINMLLDQITGDGNLKKQIGGNKKIIEVKSIIESDTEKIQNNENNFKNYILELKKDKNDPTIIHQFYSSSDEF